MGGSLFIYWWRELVSSYNRREGEYLRLSGSISGFYTFRSRWCIAALGYL